MKKIKELEEILGDIYLLEKTMIRVIWVLVAQITLGVIGLE